MEIDFISIDVETANADLSSICKIGIVFFKDGKIINKWESLINPEDYFDDTNIFIHGITEKDVKNAPLFIDIYSELVDFLDKKIVTHHTFFDRTAINRAIEKYNLKPINPIWLDTAKVVRRTWEEFAYKGYGLKNMSKVLKIDFIHHDPLEDARLSGMILIEAMNKLSLNIEDIIKRTNKSIKRLFKYKVGERPQFEENKIDLTPNEDGIFFGESITFTGQLSMSRDRAIDLALQVGCTVGKGVTKKTTLLIVGDQDIKRLAGFEKSSKHRKAEELILNGQNIQILCESDFLSMINS
ncbi:exonuclease domain-containing protein [Aliarcobacter lanthieri]|uniref:exonuclease domain-containing protein n=1 Tax=Aliarcobacter lanthieri TaxID=1355374 RepID=UPI003AAF56F2